MLSSYEAEDVSGKRNGTKIEVTNDEKEADMRNNGVQCRLINEENISEERSRPLQNSNAEPEESNSSILKKIATNLDLDLLRDNRYLAIVLGKL